MAKPGYVIQADFIRIFAVICVVLVHTVYGFYARPDYLGGTVWWLANILNTLAHTGVPLFVMLSGYLLLGKKSSSENISHRIWIRLVIPLLVWFGFFLVWNHLFHFLSFDPYAISAQLILSNMFHLYFLVILIGLYAFIPVLQEYVIPHERRMKNLILFSYIAGFFMFLSPYFWTPNATQYNSFTIWLPYLGYFLLGNWFGQQPKQSKLLVITFVGALLGSIALGYLNVYLRSIDWNTFWLADGIPYFDEYLSPNVFLLSISLFTLLLHSTKIGALVKYNRFTKLLAIIAAGTFPVYILHPAISDIIDFRYGFALEYVHPNLPLYFVERTGLIVLISFVVGIIVMQIPYVRALFGVTEPRKEKPV